jgi:hypothetical protein
MGAPGASLLGAWESIDLGRGFFACSLMLLICLCGDAVGQEVSGIRVALELDLEE